MTSRRTTAFSQSNVHSEIICLFCALSVFGWLPRTPSHQVVNNYVDQRLILINEALSFPYSSIEPLVILIPWVTAPGQKPPYLLSHIVQCLIIHEHNPGGRQRVCGAPPKET